MSLAIFFLSLNSLKAQNATIFNFDLTFTAGPDLNFWGDETNQFKFENSKKEIVTIRTMDTLFALAQKILNEKLSIQLEKQSVGKEIKQTMLGRISGFPSAKLKNVSGKLKFDKIIDVNVTVLPGGSVSGGVGPFSKRKQKVDMIVKIIIYDKEGNELKKYKERTKMDEIKTSVSVFGISDQIVLSGNELNVLFENSLLNALNSK